MKATTRNAKTQKFWQIETRDSEQLVTTAKLGPFGRDQQYKCKYKVFKSASAAEADSEKKLAATEKKGFESFEPPAAGLPAHVDMFFAATNDVFTALDMLAQGFDFTPSVQKELASGGSADVLARLAQEGVALSPECLGAAALTGKHQLVATLVAQGVPVDSTNAAGSTPLMLAAQKGKDKVVAALLDAGADVDALDGSGVSPLIHAAMSNSEAVVELILKKKPALDIRTGRGNSALTMAIGEAQGASGAKLDKARAICQLLLAAGATANDDEKAKLTQIDVVP